MIVQLTVKCLKPYLAFGMAASHFQYWYHCA